MLDFQDVHLSSYPSLSPASCVLSDDCRNVECIYLVVVVEHPGDIGIIADLPSRDVSVERRECEHMREVSHIADVPITYIAVEL